MILQFYDKKTSMKLISSLVDKSVIFDFCNHE